MRLPVQIAVRNTEVSVDAIAAIHAHARKLDAFYGRIMGCRVLVEVPQRYRIGIPIAYNVRIDLTVPGGELVIKRKPRLDVTRLPQRKRALPRCNDDANGCAG